MKADLIDALTSPQSDPNFGKKYGIALACSIASCLIVPAVFLMGYLAETIKYSGSGKKGLPDWKAPSELLVKGGVSILASLYLLPAAILILIANFAAFSGGDGFFSMSAMLARFIHFGAIIIGLAGLAFSLSGIHSYLSSGKVSDIFNVSLLLDKIRTHSTLLGMLLTLVGVVTAVLSVLSVLFGWLGVLLTMVVSPLLSLVVATGTGVIFESGEEEAVTTVVETPEADTLLISGDEEMIVTEEPTVDEDNVWKPT